MFEGILSYPSSLPDLDMVIGDHSPLPEGEGGGEDGLVAFSLFSLLFIHKQSVKYP